MPTFTPKDWIDEASPLGPVADPDIDTPLSAAALEDLETRLSDYTDAQFTLPIPYGSGDNLVSPSESALSATVPLAFEITKGTNGTPDTGDSDAGTAQPLIKFQRTKAQQRSASGGTLARLTPVVHVIQKSTANDEMVNLGMLIEADSYSTQTTHASTGDAECLKCYARVNSGSTAADAICFIAVARQDSSGGSATGLEIHMDKNSAASPYNDSSAGPDAGIRLTAGINDISVGTLIRKSGSDTGQFEMGYVVNAEDPVADTAFRDDGRSDYGLKITGYKDVGSIRIEHPTQPTPAISVAATGGVPASMDMSLAGAMVWTALDSTTPGLTGHIGDTMIDLDGGLRFNERTNPATPGANQAVFYIRDNGSGKTEAVVEFSSGNRVVLATDF